MHRLTPFVVLLVVCAVAFGALSLTAMSSLDRADDRDAALFAAAMLAAGCVASLTGVAVLVTLSAIESKVNRLLGIEPATRKTPGMLRKELRASLPPRNDGRL